jgi:hypothetical protein
VIKQRGRIEMGRMKRITRKEILGDLQNWLDGENKLYMCPADMDM